MLTPGPCRPHRPPSGPDPVGFDEVVRLIDAARGRTADAVNTALIDPYWRIGEAISRRVAADGCPSGRSRAEKASRVGEAPADDL